MKAIRLEGYQAVVVNIPKADTRGELKALQNIIGGYIETFRVAEDAVLLVDEDGYVKCLPPNPAATLVAGKVILGTALLVGLAVNDDGEMCFTDFPERYYKKNT